MRRLSLFGRFIVGMVMVSVFVALETCVNIPLWASLLLIFAAFLAIEVILNCISNNMTDYDK